MLATNSAYFYHGHRFMFLILCILLPSKSAKHLTLMKTTEVKMLIGESSNQIVEDVVSTLHHSANSITQSSCWISFSNFSRLCFWNLFLFMAVVFPLLWRLRRSRRNNLYAKELQIPCPCYSNKMIYSTWQVRYPSRRVVKYSPAVHAVLDDLFRNFIYF